jgi:hypothetical protein
MRIGHNRVLPGRAAAMVAQVIEDGKATNELEAHRVIEDAAAALGLTVTWDDEDYAAGWSE